MNIENRTVAYGLEITDLIKNENDVEEFQSFSLYDI